MLFFKYINLKRLTILVKQFGFEFRGGEQESFSTIPYLPFYIPTFIEIIILFIYKNKSNQKIIPENDIDSIFLQVQA